MALPRAARLCRSPGQDRHVRDAEQSMVFPSPAPALLWCVYPILNAGAACLHPPSSPLSFAFSPTTTPSNFLFLVLTFFSKRLMFTAEIFICIVLRHFDSCCCAHAFKCHACFYPILVFCPCIATPYSFLILHFSTFLIVVHLCHAHRNMHPLLNLALQVTTMTGRHGTRFNMPLPFFIWNKNILWDDMNILFLQAAFCMYVSNAVKTKDSGEWRHDL